MDAFLSPQCRPETLDRFFHRRSILNALMSARPMLRGTLLDIGCGDKPYRDILDAPQGAVTRYVGLDLARNTRYGAQQPPELEWEGKVIPASDASFDCAMATEVLEHCLYPRDVLAEVFRVLKPGGVFFLTVPFLWPLHDVPDDHHRYTPFSLEHMIRDTGFARVELTAMGGWDGALAQMIGLWVRRRPMPPLARKVLSLMAWPAVATLARKDRPPRAFSSGPMITGISGLAWKA